MKQPDLNALRRDLLACETKGDCDTVFTSWLARRTSTYSEIERAAYWTRARKRELKR